MAGLKVFISYAHEGDIAQRVLALSDRLRVDGLECEIDLYELDPEKGWRVWMREKLEWADVVLTVCTEKYHRRSRQEEKDGGRGVTFEAHMLFEELYRQGMVNNKIIPILFDDTPDEVIPDELQAYKYFRLQKGKGEHFDEEQYDDLFRRLTKQPRYQRPDVGPLKVRSPENAGGRATPSAPVFYNVPFGTEFFTGRESHLEELERRLQSEHSVAITQAIVGLGGIGKTQVAIEYCKKHREKYPDGVFWVDASSAATLTATYAECAKGLGVVPVGAKEDEGVAALMGYLGQKPGWLVVMDNADAPDEVRNLRPRFLHGHVLVTTRDQRPRMGPGKPLRLDCWSIPEATKFLLKRVEGKESEAEELAKELEGLPLALEQAAAYLADSTLSIGGYLEKYRAVNLDFLEEHEAVEGDYGKKTVARTWGISIERLKEDSPAAVEALNACAFLDPESIQIRIFQDAGEHLGPELEQFDLADRSVLHEQVVRPLTRYSLVKWDPDSKSLSVHRLVQVVSRWRLGEEVAEVLDGVYAALGVIFPKDYENPSTWAEGAMLLPHVSRSAKFWEEENAVEVAKLWANAGYGAWAAGRYLQARYLQEQVLEACRRILGPEHPHTLNSMNNLALTLRDLGDATGAKELQEQVLEACRRILGPEHPDTLQSMNNLSLTLRDLGDTTAAKELQEQTLKARRRILGPEHPDTLTSMNNLAATLRALDDTAGAKELHEQALKARRRILGPEHPHTLNSMNNLATTLRALGDTAGAKELHKQVLKARRRILGPEHPQALISIWWMGIILKDEGDLAGAKEHLSAAHQGFLKVLGEKHPSTQNTAQALRSLEENKE